MGSVTTLRVLRDDVLDRLGDTVATPLASRIWSEVEVEAYIVEGYRDFAHQTRALWDMTYLDDLPYTGNYTNSKDRAFFDNGWPIHNPISYTNEDDRDFQAEDQSAVNHTNTDERDQDFLFEDLISATEKLPDDVNVVDRVTYDGRKIIPLQSSKLKKVDRFFELTRGTVLGYLLDRDGLRTLRKYKVPSSPATYYRTVGMFGILCGAALVYDVTTGTTLRIHIDEWGCVFSGVLDSPPSLFYDFMPGPRGGSVASIGKTIALTDLPEFAGDVVDGDVGLLRRMPGYFGSRGPLGFATHISKDEGNTRVEFYRRPAVITGKNDTFEIPENYIPVLRHYALQKAYSRRGVGQEPQLAQLYMERYEEGVARAKRRIDAIHAAKVFRMGGNGPGPSKGRRPYPVLPRNFTG